MNPLKKANLVRSLINDGGSASDVWALIWSQYSD